MHDADATEGLTEAFRKVMAASEGLPGVVQGTFYGTPTIKVGKKSFCRVRDTETIVLFCPMEEEEILIAAAPDIYFGTDDYKGWPAVLARLDAMAPEELAHRLATGWRRVARKRLTAAYDRSHFDRNHP